MTKSQKKIFRKKKFDVGEIRTWDHQIRTQRPRFSQIGCFSDCFRALLKIGNFPTLTALGRHQKSVSGFETNLDPLNRARASRW